MPRWGHASEPSSDRPRDSCHLRHLSSLGPAPTCERFRSHSAGDVQVESPEDPPPGDATGREFLPAPPSRPRRPGWSTAGRQQNLGVTAVSYTHLRAHETDSYLVCRLLLE